MQFYKDLLKKELIVLHFPHGTNSFKMGENVVCMSMPCLKSVSCYVAGKVIRCTLTKCFLGYYGGKHFKSLIFNYHPQTKFGAR